VSNAILLRPCSPPPLPFGLNQFLNCLSLDSPRPPPHAYKSEGTVGSKASSLFFFLNQNAFPKIFQSLSSALFLTPVTKGTELHRKLPPFVFITVFYSLFVFNHIPPDPSPLMSPKPIRFSYAHHRFFAIVPFVVSNLAHNQKVIILYEPQPFLSFFFLY